MTLSCSFYLYNDKISQRVPVVGWNLFGVKMRMPYHHGALRAALLEAAEDILEREGRQELTLRAVARRVGVSHAAPKPHFGDLAGLLTALAASGFIRLKAHCEAALQDVRHEGGARLLAVAQAYVAFARQHPGLFRLMLGSERLDWGSPELAAAGGAAFALLTQDDPAPKAPPNRRDFDTLVTAMTRLSLMHGLATLLVDGRVEPFLAETPGGSLDALVGRVLGTLRNSPHTKDGGDAGC